MKNLPYLVAVCFAVFGCQPRPDEKLTELPQDSVAQAAVAVPLVALLAGSDTTQRVACAEGTCEIIYTDYTVTTSPLYEAPGERIVITYHDTQVSLEIKETAGYFVGLVGDYALIDIGTGNIRELAVYDLPGRKVAALLQGLIEDPVIKEGGLHYTILLASDKVVALKLPPCTNPDLEISGYTEAIRYDFSTQKSISTQTYHCIQ